jgi:hypothetical protein
VTEALGAAGERQRFDLGAAEVDPDPDWRRAPWVWGEGYVGPRLRGTAGVARAGESGWR